MLKNFIQSIVGSTVSQEVVLTLGGVPIASEMETLHLLLAGSTGTGKTTGVVELMQGLTRRGDRMIVCDPNGFYLSRFFQEHKQRCGPSRRRH